MAGRPTSAEEVAEAVRAHRQVRVRGAGTKGRLVDGPGELLEMSGLRGIEEYEASEYTFTARAGTPVREIEEALAEKGQYLPFDPMFAGAGATLGGSVAAGFSGPGRFRYGGMRDFLLGVQLVDGRGTLVRSGGKVVKNAAGFDLPKFMVGSLGRMGILTEVCFKVFPRPRRTRTLRIAAPAPAAAVERLVRVAASRWEADALDYVPREAALYLRLGAPGEALDSLAAEIEAEWPGEVAVLDDEAERACWLSSREMTWANGGRRVKVPVSPSRMAALQELVDGLDGCEARFASGGAVAWLSVAASLDALRDGLARAGLIGLLFAGPADDPLWLGKRSEPAILADMKQALDPDGRFPAI
ncbi:MAG: FAD-binding protein [Akkermansiaceae bacterium]|nr:FAD-binding protein [Akkermansiaceae bacterium]NNM29041.1 FAD-binding protein [Akkermansiaceae bacterium]